MHTEEKKTAPRIVSWEITRRCELACRHCRGAARDCDYAGEFSTEECCKTIDALAAFSKPMIILTGGEPLMRDDLFDVARYATEQGCRVVLATCGHLLTDQIARRLKESGVMAVSVSLDAATAEQHDAFRGISGAYEKTVAALDHLKAGGISFQINTTVSKLNIDELPQILDRAIEHGASTMDFFFLVPTGRGSDIAELALDASERDRAFEWIAAQATSAPIRVKTTCAPQYGQFLGEAGGRVEGVSSQVGADDSKLPARNLKLETGNSKLSGAQLGTHNSHRGAPFRGCMGGRGFVFISHTGSLQPCGFLDLPCGNLREANFDFASLYNRSEVFGNMRTLNPFSGCPARAYVRTGNYMAKE